MASTPRGGSFENPSTSASSGVAAVVALLHDEQRTLSMSVRNVAFEGDGSTDPADREHGSGGSAASVRQVGHSNTEAEVPWIRRARDRSLETSLHETLVADSLRAELELADLRGKRRRLLQLSRDVLEARCPCGIARAWWFGYSLPDLA